MMITKPHYLLNIIALTLCSTLLGGCVATAVVASGAVAGAATASDPREAGTVFSDQNIAYQIQHQVITTPSLSDNANIDVASYNGTVLLTGQTLDPKIQQQVINIAQAVPGVKMIYNEIEIKQPVPTSVHAKDSWITTKARSELTITQGWSANNFKVVTSDGTVYLMGLVKPKQAQPATEALSKISGVNKVVTLLQYQNPPTIAPPTTTLAQNTKPTTTSSKNSAAATTNSANSPTTTGGA